MRQVDDVQALARKFGGHGRGGNARSDETTSLRQRHARNRRNGGATRPLFKGNPTTRTSGVVARNDPRVAQTFGDADHGFAEPVNHEALSRLLLQAL